MSSATRVGFAVVFATGAGLLFLSVAPVARAAGNADSASAASIEEVVVTARKREEHLQDVPDAVTVVSTELIENAHLTNPHDLAALIPNFNFDSTFSPNRTLISIRGISQAETSEAPVAVVVDGVQLAHPAFLNQQLMDVEQIEVLRGPQGSLYGRNAIGGAVLISTKQPGQTLEGNVRISFASGRDRRVSGGISGPLGTQAVHFRLAGSYRDNGGQIRNAFDGTNLDRTRDYTLRTNLIFDPSSALKLDFRAGFLRSKGGSLNGEVVPNARFDRFDPSFFNENAGMNNSRKLQDYAAKIDYDFGPVTLTSITGYSHTEDTLTGDADFTAVPAVVQRATVNVKAFTHEDRLVSNGAGRLRWLLGVYYQDRTTENDLEIPFDDGTGHPTSNYLIRSFDAGKSESIAWFGNASYDLRPDLELTLGVRSDRDKRSSEDRAFAGSRASATFTAVQPKVQLRYKITPAASVYGSYGRGFRSGGFNAFYAAGGVSREYPKEISASYEVGFKGAFLSNALVLNVAAFHSDFDGQQIFFITTNPPSQNITTVRKTQIDGGEVELTAQPSMGLVITASYGLADATIEDFNGTGLFHGNDSPQSPAYSLSLAVQYRLELANELALRSYVNVSRKGMIQWDLANSVATPPKDIVNARFALERGAWSLAVYGENLTDERYPTLALIDAFGPGASYRSPNHRRQYGLEGAYRF
jgi:iron complex outermembrane receptor protein